jgi:hypothetical protein
VLRAPIAACPAVVVPWPRWGGVRCGAQAPTGKWPPAGQVSEGGGSPKRLSDEEGRRVGFSDGGGAAAIEEVVHRRGGCGISSAAQVESNMLKQWAVASLTGAVETR